MRDWNGVWRHNIIESIMLPRLFWLGYFVYEGILGTDRKYQELPVYFKE